LGRIALTHRHFNLAKQRHDLLRAEPLLRHDPSSFPRQFLSNRLVQKGQVRSLAHIVVMIALAVLLALHVAASFIVGPRAVLKSLGEP
jgi:hypothetical protein